MVLLLGLSMLVQFAKAFRRASSFSSTQAFWACLIEAEEVSLLLETTLVDVFGCELEDEARLSMMMDAGTLDLNAGKEYDRRSDVDEV